ncbi:hypothetical protein FRC04_004151 [Tulasnella sp. 424]|nr:hypothetical protein FRC04_004151 [Tulasnella sp. 424]KAG8968893.1 hypothetical protein FRC05_001261 [Tulasnella sp. 425]
MYSDSDPKEVPPGWKDPRATVTIGGAQYYKDSDHWYDDGNIVLLVQDTAFRLFQGILIKRSQVMKDMLGLPQPPAPIEAKESVPNQQPTFEGVPVVTLHDKARHFTLLLDAMLPKDCTKLPISEDLGSDGLMGLTQVAKKYEVDDAAARAVTVLEKILPTVERPEDTSYTSRGEYWNIRRYVSIINWARICGLPQFLPMPFYQLATHEWKDTDSFNVKAFQKLSHQDQLRIHIGRTRLQALIIDVGVQGLGRNCGGRYGCGMTRDGPIWKAGSREERCSNLLLHPLEELKRRKIGDLVSGLCESCSTAVTAWNQRVEDQVLRGLGSCFTMGDEQSEFGGCP